MMVKNGRTEGKRESAKQSVVALGVLKWKRVRMSAVSDGLSHSTDRD